MNTNLFAFCLHLADNALVLCQRNSEWTGHGPVLEQDIAITNISLDLLGQSRNLYQYAAELYNGFSAEEKQSVDQLVPRLWKDYGRELQEDDLAFLREERQFLNLLLVELSRGDWAQSVLRQFFFTAFQQLQYGLLQNGGDERLAAIAEKSLKEVAYHLRWSAEWVIRLGDGTEESHRRLAEALDGLWAFTGEFFEPAGFETAAGIAVDGLREAWQERVRAVLEEATLALPAATWAQSGGKQGRHTEHLGYLLAEMQYLQRAYPNNVW